MLDENNHNLIYFESSSMRDLFDRMEKWQIANQKRLLSIDIQQDSGNFCCIALTNPTEVVIKGGSPIQVDVRGVNTRDGALQVYDTSGRF
jgi:hypothetical protein